jgi:hypothetical protein
MILGIGAGVLLLTLWLAAEKDVPFDRDEMLRVRSYSDKIRREEVLPFD